MKKKLISAFFLLSMCISSAFAVNLYVDGNRLTPDVPPTIVSGRTMVPLRSIFEALNADVQWNQATRTATATKGNTTVTVTVNQKTAYVNGVAKTLDVPAQVIKNRTMVPARFVSEALNARVQWDASTQTVYVSTNETFQSLQIVESGCSVSDYGYLTYAVKLRNPNVNTAVEFPTIRITARDSNNIILGTEDQVLSVIYPQQDFWYSGQAFHVEETPASVEFSVVPPSDYNIVKTSALEHPKFTPLTVENTAVRSQEYIGDRIVGEVKNPNDYDIDMAVVSIVFRNKSGKVIGGTSTFVDKLPAHGSVPFDTALFSDLPGASYEVYANVW